MGMRKNEFGKYVSLSILGMLGSSGTILADTFFVSNRLGADGLAALNLSIAVFGLINGLGMLFGIGGATRYTIFRSQEDGAGADRVFTAALLSALAAGLCFLCAGLFWPESIARALGAEGHLLPLCTAYLKTVLCFAPCFILNHLLMAFLRNDGAPGLATAAVLTGGIFNVFGDYFCVFTLDMGIEGAGLATAIGSMLSLIVMLSHFFSRKNTLRPVRIRSFFKKSREIAVTGFSTFFIDIAMGILTMMFNRQIMQYLGTDALSVYGVIVNISTFVQCCAYSVGQAAQPIISANYGAQKYDRIRGTLKYSLAATTFFALLWTALALACPTMFIYIFMDPTATVLQIAPGIIRCYGLSFLLLPLNIFSTYYFQSLMKPRSAFFISVARGLVLSGILIYVLPLLGGGEFIWFAMPITELIVSAAVIWMMVRYTHALRPDIV